MKTIDINETINTKDFGKNVKQPVWFLSVHKGDAIEIKTEDGLGTDFICSVCLNNFLTDDVYYLDYGFIGKMRDLEDEETGQQFCIYHDSETLALEMIDKIKAKGVINLDYWLKA